MQLPSRVLSKIQQNTKLISTAHPLYLGQCRALCTQLSKSKHGMKPAQVFPPHSHLNPLSIALFHTGPETSIGAPWSLRYSYAARKFTGICEVPPTNPPATVDTPLKWGPNSTPVYKRYLGQGHEPFQCCTNCGGSNQFAANRVFVFELCCRAPRPFNGTGCAVQVTPSLLGSLHSLPGAMCSTAFRLCRVCSGSVQSARCNAQGAYCAMNGRGYKTTPKWGIKPPPTPFLAIFDPWGGFMPPWGGFIPPFAGVGLSPQRGGFIPPFGHWGGFITPLGWFYPPFWVILSPYWRGGGVGQSQCEPRKLSPGRQTDAQCTLQPALV